MCICEELFPRRFHHSDTYCWQENTSLSHTSVQWSPCCTDTELTPVFWYILLPKCCSSYEHRGLFGNQPRCIQGHIHIYIYRKEHKSKQQDSQVFWLLGMWREEWEVLPTPPGTCRRAGSPGYGKTAPRYLCNFSRKYQWFCFFIFKFDSKKTSHFSTIIIKGQICVKWGFSKGYKLMIDLFEGFKTCSLQQILT